MKNIITMYSFFQEQSRNKSAGNEQISGLLNEGYVHVKFDGIKPNKECFEGTRPLVLRTRIVIHNVGCFIFDSENIETCLPR